MIKFPRSLTPALVSTHVRLRYIIRNLVTHSPTPPVPLSFHRSLIPLCYNCAIVPILKLLLRPLNERQFAPIAAKADPIPKVTFIDNEPDFRWALLQDEMAFDKLHEGIKKFAADAVTLKDILKKKLSA